MVRLSERQIQAIVSSSLVRSRSVGMKIPVKHLHLIRTLMCEWIWMTGMSHIELDFNQSKLMVIHNQHIVVLKSVGDVVEVGLVVLRGDVIQRNL